MGTPGDKVKRKVVEEKHLDLPEHSIEDTSPVDLSSVQSVEEMGFLEAPSIQLQMLTPVNILPQPTESIQIISKPEIFSTGNLEQARIEDYYSQTKFYPSIYEPSTSYSVSSNQRSSKVYYSSEEPGPSGLQTQKSKPSTSLTKINTKKKIKQPSVIQLPKKPYTCQVCQKSYTNIDKLNKHQQIHSTVSPFKCEHCKKSFSSKFKLVRHMLIHSDRKPFSCTVCERTFHRKDHLKNHIKIHSPTKKVYICEKEHCKKEYTSLLSYKKHLALHSAQEGSLECQICSSVFSTKEDILFHLKIHAGSRTVKDPNEKKYRCEHCDRKFFTKKDVRRHLVVHTGMRDFLCQFCPQRFGRKDHLGRHIKKSHSKNLPIEDLDTSSESTSVKVETIVKSELTTPECEVPQDTTEDMFVGGHEMIPFSLEEEGTSSLMKFEPTFEDTSATRTQLTESNLPTDILGYCLDDVQEFVPQNFIGPFLEGNVRDDFSLMMSSSSQSELIQIFDMQSSSSSSSLPKVQVSDNSGILNETEVLNNPEIQRLLQPSEEVNLPLPGFSQTFQSPPPPPPPQPPP